MDIASINRPISFISPIKEFDFMRLACTTVVPAIEGRVLLITIVEASVKAN